MGRNRYAGRPIAILILVCISSKRNIETIVGLEEAAWRERTWDERISDAIAFFFGNMTAVAPHLAVFALWVIANVNLIPGLTPFDPFPYRAACRS